MPLTNRQTLKKMAAAQPAKPAAKLNPQVAKPAPKSKPAVKKSHQELGRFPNGTTVMLTYDGVFKVWTGNLCVGPSKMFARTDSSIHRLLTNFWNIDWVPWLAANPTALPAEASPAVDGQTSEAPPAPNPS